MAELQYEPRDSARPVVVEEDGEVTRIIVKMQGMYAPLPLWVINLELVSLAVVPLWLIGTILVRWWCGTPSPPRAVFTINNEKITVEFRDPRTGDTTSFTWPLASVREMRANRYDSGLWIDVSGHVKDTFLRDLKRETIERLEDELRTVRALRAAK